MLFGLFFLLGVFIANFLQILLNIKPLYKIWKVVELGFLKNLLQSETLRHQSLEILRLCYEEANKLEEYETVKEAVNNKFIQFQDVSIQQLKETLPYDIQYNNTKEAVGWLTSKLKKGELNDV